MSSKGTRLQNTILQGQRVRPSIVLNSHGNNRDNSRAEGVGDTPPQLLITWQACHPVLVLVGKVTPWHVHLTSMGAATAVEKVRVVVWMFQD